MFMCPPVFTPTPMQLSTLSHCRLLYPVDIPGCVLLAEHHVFRHLVDVRVSRYELRSFPSGGYWVSSSDLRMPNSKLEDTWLCSNELHDSHLVHISVKYKESSNSHSLGISVSPDEPCRRFGEIQQTLNTKLPFQKLPVPSRPTFKRCSEPC